MFKYVKIVARFARNIEWYFFCDFQNIVKNVEVTINGLRPFLLQVMAEMATPHLLSAWK